VDDCRVKHSCRPKRRIPRSLPAGPFRVLTTVERELTNDPDAAAQKSIACSFGRP